jgi:hypothetical protein
LGNQFLTIWDLVLTPVFLGVLIFIATRHRNKHYPPGHPLRKYYLLGLYAKFFGAIFIAFVYQYYYGGGDTSRFFEQSRIINSSLHDSFTTWAKLMLRISPDKDPKLYPYASQMMFYHDPASYMVCVIGALFGLLNFTTYIPIALIFAYLSFTGIWAMYTTFVNLYPKLTRQLAVAFLFIPSTVVWGSSIFKDTVCMFGLGWLTFTTFRLFVNRDFSIKNIFLLVLSFYLIAVIKIYILLSFMPALSLWILFNYSNRIHSSASRLVVRFFFIGLTIAGFLFFANKFSEELNRYSLQNISRTANATREWIAYATDEEGSGYDLGDFDPTMEGMLSKFPQAVTVTLYRPFLWEAKKIIVLLSSIEAMIFLFFTLKVLFKRSKSLPEIIKDPNLLFCFIFSIVFAFAVGISSYNFGALSRYKIPCLPFFATLLIVLLYSKKDGKKQPFKKLPSHLKKLSTA